MPFKTLSLSCACPQGYHKAVGGQSSLRYDAMVLAYGMVFATQKGLFCWSGWEDPRSRSIGNHDCSVLWCARGRQGGQGRRYSDTFPIKRHDTVTSCTVTLCHAILPTKSCYLVLSSFMVNVPVRVDPRGNTPVHGCHGTCWRMA